MPFIPHKTLDRISGKYRGILKRPKDILALGIRRTMKQHHVSYDTALALKQLSEQKIKDKDGSLDGIEEEKYIRSLVNTIKNTSEKYPKILEYMSTNTVPDTARAFGITSSRAYQIKQYIVDLAEVRDTTYTQCVKSFLKK